MISIDQDEQGYRIFNIGKDGRIHGIQMIDQIIAILMGWGLAIDDELKGKP